MDKQTNNPKPICPFNFFEVGAITSVTLTVNLRGQMFRMALLLLEDNNCAKLF